MNAPRHPDADKMIDPELILPPAVRRAAEAANSTQAAFVASITPPDPNAPPVAPADPNAPPVLAPPVVEPPVPPQPVPPQPAPPEPSAEVIPPIGEIEGEKEPAEPLARAAYWKHRFKAMKGRYDHELPRKNELIGQLTSRVGQLEGVIASQPAPRAPTTSAPAVTSGGNVGDPPTAEEMRALGITAEKADMWGDEWVQTLVDASRATRAGILSELAPQLATIQRSTAQTAADRVVQTLSKEVPDWQKVNYDPDFLAWLALPDEFSGATRQLLLNKAFDEANAPRIVSFFKSFKAGATPAPSAETPTTTPTLQPPLAPAAPPSNRLDLTDLAGPGRARPAATAAATPAGQKPVYTRKYISEFYASKQRNAWIGREPEMNAIEADIFQAQADGRIQQ